MQTRTTRPARIIPTALFAVLIASPAASQVFDMGALTGTLSQDAVTQSEEERAGSRRESAAETEALNRANCLRLGDFRKRYGATDPRVAKVKQLCGRLGYRTR